MAKKNANNRSKTATEKMTKSTEPKIQVIAKWTGMNISNLAPSWVSSEYYDKGEFENTTDEELRQWLIQDNMFCCDNGSVETRHDTVLIGAAPEGQAFSGKVFMIADMLYLSLAGGGIAKKRLDDPAWTPVQIVKRDPAVHTGFSEFGVLNGRFIALSNEGVMYTGFVSPSGDCSRIFSAKYLPDSLLSAGAISVAERGSLTAGCPTAIGFSYSLSNRYGNTRGSKWSPGVIYNASPAEFNHQNYLNISITLPAGYTTGQDTADQHYDITGVDIYCHIDEAQDAIFIGHVNVPNGATSVSFDWTGAVNSLESWPMSPLSIPMENMTGGPEGCFLNIIDDKLYIWGSMRQPYRLWYGGNPGNEIQFNRGTGGGWLDADPQQFTKIWDFWRFKTYNATILTALGDQPNTGDSPRYNVVEHNMTLTNEIQAKGMFFERVDNVLGTKNRNASVVVYDGLYAVNRYGVGLTTMPMSSNIQDKQDYISEQIKPIFHEFESDHLNNSKLIGYRQNLYMVFGNDNDGGLDNLIFCYNIKLKAWFTYSIPEVMGHVRNIFYVDSVSHIEGIGIVTDLGVYYIKEVGEHKPDTAPVFDVHLETGQISSKQPLQTTSYLEQVELRFDYIVGDLTVYINYWDYWGRRNKVTKKIKVSDLRRNWSEYVRVGTLVESYNIQIVGKARCRLTHFMCKVYPQSNRVGLVYGLDDHSSRKRIHGGNHQDIHHYLDSYNNLKNAIVP